MKIIQGLPKKNASISGTCSLGTKTIMRAFLAVFQFIFYTQVENLLDVKHFTPSTICSSAYIHLQPTSSQSFCNISFVTSAVAAVIHA
jgi:hypothetical protein